VAIVEQLKDQVEQALFRLFQKNESDLHAFSSDQIVSYVIVEPCKRPEFGDFSCGVAMRLVQGRDLSAISLAQEISDLINERNEIELGHISVSSPGFINFSVSSGLLSSVLFEIHSIYSETTHVHAAAWTDRDSKNCYELCCSILGCATEPAFDLINEIELAPFLSAEAWQKCKLQYKKSKQFFEPMFASEANLDMRQKSLILMLERAVRLLAAPPHRQLQTRIIECGSAIAESFAKFYQGSRIFTDQPELTKARLGLVLAVKLVLEQMPRS